MDESSLLERISDLRSVDLTDEQIRFKYFSRSTSPQYPPGDSRGWKLPLARARVRSDKAWRDRIESCLYRPFDRRLLYNTTWMVDWSRPDVMGNMRGGRNIGLVTVRQVAEGTFNHVLVTRAVVDNRATVSNKGIAYLFPLRLCPDLGDGQRLPTEPRSNLDPRFVRDLSANLGFNVGAPQVDEDRAESMASDAFHYMYAILHSPEYRARYSQFLEFDFPRVPLPPNLELFNTLSALGRDLVALHLLEDDYAEASWNRAGTQNPFSEPQATFAGTSREVAKGYPKYAVGRVAINTMAGFEGVPEAVWNFHIGGYQVCEKWLKDRRGRTLSDEDIAHYGRIVIALRETIRIMGEIDTLIEEHGGWPEAFQSAEVGS